MITQEDLAKAIKSLTEKGLIEVSREVDGIKYYRLTGVKDPVDLKESEIEMILNAKLNGGM